MNIDKSKSAQTIRFLAWHALNRVCQHGQTPKSLARRVNRMIQENDAALRIMGITPQLRKAMDPDKVNEVLSASLSL